MPCATGSILGCSPTLVSTAELYKRGVYTPYVTTTLERYDEILKFLSDRFEEYQPEKLFWPLCPQCGYIDETRLETVRAGIVGFYCHRCERSVTIPFDQVTGKLNWKLDCAARWAHFQVDAEPFSKSYLEPKTGTFTIAQALSRKFFDGPCVSRCVTASSRWIVNSASDCLPRFRLMHYAA